MQGTTRNDFNHGINAAARTVAALLALLAVACGASNNRIAESARRVPVAHLAELPPAERATALAKLPVVLEIRQGDRFPIEAVLDSALLALHTEGTWTVEARRTFYVLLRKEGAPLISVDGVDFEKPARNSFGVGIQAERDKPATVRIALKWRADEAKAP
ncbi:MAG TPA: hypothetical protein VGK73_21765 [Polyangiaceae bacterium]